MNYKVQELREIAMKKKELVTAAEKECRDAWDKVWELEVALGLKNDEPDDDDWDDEDDSSSHDDSQRWLTEFTARQAHYHSR